MDEPEIDKTFSSSVRDSRKDAETGGSWVTTPMQPADRKPSDYRTEDGHGGGGMTRASLNRKAHHSMNNRRGSKGSGYSGYRASRNTSEKIYLDQGVLVNRKTCRGKMQYCVM